jgi:hypothetical protein
MSSSLGQLNLDASGVTALVGATMTATVTAMVLFLKFLWPKLSGKLKANGESSESNIIPGDQIIEAFKEFRTKHHQLRNRVQRLNMRMELAAQEQLHQKARQDEQDRTLKELSETMTDVRDRVIKLCAANGVKD